ncbi:Fc.00g030170.m01.CDS01 [Cosmosporella sp. VM-42]
MTLPLIRVPFVCRRCLQASRRAGSLHHLRYSSTSESRKPEDPKGKSEKVILKDEVSSPKKEPGPMARRLEEATEEALFTGGRAGRRAIEDAGFSDELKEKLLAKVQDANFRNEFSGALAEAGLSSSAGEGTRNIATSQAWTGEESTEDSILRMLDDSKPRLKPGSRGKYQPPSVDMRLSRGPAKTAGQKAASAKDMASIYTGLGMKETAGLTDEEKEKRRKHFKERFEPAARSVPNTISGLAALANERIEDAIARGQFKNIPRGTSVERDTRAENPFIDTTEYIMNKMIQRQEIVPPWIEKQQELVKAANVFRSRLRNDWRRHAARMIASKGGELQDQMAKAEDYAAAEEVHNPRTRSVDQIPVSASATDDPVMVKMRQQVAQATEATPTTPKQSERGRPLPPPFRDPDWEKTELAYMTLSIDNLNSITRSYNLMAPDLAKKPYFSLQRELKSCFADVAPTLANEIKDRATGLKSHGLGGVGVERKPGILEGLAGGGADVRIHLEAEEKVYGLREWWKNFWKKA